MTSALSRDRFLVDEMLKHLAVIDAVRKTDRDAISRNPTKRYALEHACELLSEAAKKTSRKFKSANPDFPWSGLRQLRTAVAHPYDEGVSTIKFDRLWQFVVEDTPKLLAQLRRAKFA